jgi:tetratricopeptide (TPR) repeat protein
MINFGSSRITAFAILLIACSSGYSQVIRPNDSRHTEGSQQRSGSRSQDAQALVRQGQEYFRNKQYNEAIAALQNAIEIEPGLAVARIHLAQTLLAVGRAEQAMAEIKQAIELDPNDAHAYVGLGNVAGALRRYAEAIDAYKQATNLDPNYFGAYVNLGTVYGMTARFPESAEAFQQALRIEPKNADALNGLGIAQFRLGQYEEGIQTVKRAVRINPGFVNAYLNLARWYETLGRYEESADAFTAVTRIVPKFPAAYFERSLDYLFLGQGEAAASDARKFLELNDWHSDRAEYMVIVAALGYRQAGKASEAKEVLDLAAKRSNTQVWPYQLISFLRGDLTAEALLAMATNNDRMTEAHGYIGMDLLLKDQREEALPHFTWVKQHGNNTFVEYKLASIQLNKSANSGSPTK